MTLRSKSAALWAGLGVSAVAGGLSRFLELAQPHTPLTRFGSAAYGPLHLIAYAIAFHFCRKISSDHRAHSTMRIAWLLMAASCATAIVRHGFEWITFLLGWHQTSMLTTLVSLRQIPTVLGLVLLTAGLLAMWSSFAAIGLGLRFRGRDAGLLLVVLAFTLFILSHRQDMHDARSAYPLMRYLQSTSPVLLAVPALFGLVLQRISQEMGKGQLATSLRYLMWSLLLRLASLLVTLSPVLAGIPAIAISGTAAFWAAPWVFALAVVNRWGLTVSASSLAERYEANPEQELAELSVTLTQPGAGPLQPRK